MVVLKLILCLVFGYLIGAFSFSITISKYFFGNDVRKEGSGNAGATNMARSFGILPGIITLVGDILKAVVSVYAGKLIAGEWGMVLAGIACNLGHCYPVYYGFKGGKGVSVGLALALCADWRAGITAIVVFTAVVMLSKKVSLSSISGAVGAAICCLIDGCSVSSRIMIFFAVIMIFIRHKENIRRLLAGTEPDFHVNKK